MTTPTPPRPFGLTADEAWKLKGLTADVLQAQLLIERAQRAVDDLAKTKAAADRRLQAYVDDLAAVYGFDPTAAYVLDADAQTLTPTDVPSAGLSPPTLIERGPYAHANDHPR